MPTVLLKAYVDSLLGVMKYHKFIIEDVFFQMI